MDKFLKYWPVALAVVAVTSSFATAQFQIKLHSMEIEDLSESVDENEEWLSELQHQINQLD